MNIATIINTAVAADGWLTADIPDDWMQGRTAYGGISAALALAAVRRAIEDLPPLRSAQLAYLSPLAGRIRTTAQILRRGTGSTFLRADLHGESGLGLTATFLFKRARSSEVEFEDLPAPQAPAPEEIEPGPNRSPSLKLFTHHFDYAQAKQRTEARTPDVLRWIRLKEREGLDPTTEILAVGDAQPPAALRLLKELKPASSLNWTINLLAPEAVTRDGWWLLSSTACLVRDGFSSQSMRVWNRDGIPVAIGTQCVAVFG